MAENDLDYHIDEDLEHLFHSDLQNLELGHDEPSHDDVIGDHLPEWLVGVIVVIIMLIIAFFVMIITSLIKNRAKNRSARYAGAGAAAACDDLESGKIGDSGDPSMKMTSFTTVPETINDDGLPAEAILVSSDTERLTSASGTADGIHGVQGCRNPLFVDDDPDSDDNNNDGSDAKNDNGDNKGNRRSSAGAVDVCMPSTSDECRGNDAADHGKSKGMPHKYKHSSAAKKSVVANKITELQKDQITENEAEVCKRIFASKAKTGNQTASKRERSKGNSISESITSPESGGHKDKNKDGTKRPENGVKSGTHSPSNKNSKEGKDGNGCCEDSGIELGASDSPTKDEAGGSSEADEAEGGAIITTKEVVETHEEVKQDNLNNHNDEGDLPMSKSNDTVPLNTFSSSTESSPSESPNINDTKSERHNETVMTSCPQSPAISFTSQIANKSFEDNLISDQEHSINACKDIDLGLDLTPVETGHEAKQEVKSPVVEASTEVTSPSTTLRTEDDAGLSEVSLNKEHPSPNMQSDEHLLDATNKAFTDSGVPLQDTTTVTSAPASSPSSPASSCPADDVTVEETQSFSTNL